MTARPRSHHSDFRVAKWLNTKLSHITATAICARMNSAFMIGISRWSSRESLDPMNAISAATGVGYSRATDSSSGKLRLNATDETVVGTGRRSTVAIAAIQTKMTGSLNSRGCCKIE